MWGLLIAACVGIFSSMFNINPSAGMSRYDESPVYRQEYDHSYFEDGFQANNEPSTKETLGEKTSEITSRSSETDEKTFSGINIPVDVSKPSETRKNENSTDALTVLSGN